MKTSTQSELTWLAFGLLFLLGRRKRKHTVPGKVPGGHRVPDVLSLAQLRELATAVGMAEPDVGAAIAMAESSGNTKAVGDKGESIGLWQINIPSCPKRFKNRDMLKNAGFNAEAALAMSNGGTEWTAWRTFKNGAYKKHLPKT